MVHEYIRYKQSNRFAWYVIGEKTVWWTTTLVILSFVDTLKQSKKRDNIHTVSIPITDFR